MTQAVGSAASLQSRTTSKRLEQIAALRFKNVGQHVNLPQIIVCGDQSTGKSSVLEGLTEIPFPRQEGICTRFATQIIIEHTDDSVRHIEASIVPHEVRTEEDRTRLLNWQRTLNHYDELADTIYEAGGLMGIREFGENTEGPAFAFDILSIKVTGPTGMHLMVVDLPGLIATTSDTQTERDKGMVHELVESYMKNPRTIILAVIQAGNDVANQTVIQKARGFDTDGQRTVGIITKPDLINQGSESRIARLANNQDTTKLKLGWFLLKNPSPAQMDTEPTFERRRQWELDFFSGQTWRDVGLDAKRVGIMALRGFVQRKLDQHIEHELPAVREEISTLLRSAQRELIELGMERTTSTSIRMHLSRLANEAQSHMKSGLNGSYMDGNADSFTSKSRSTRLRARTHQLNSQFAERMSRTGCLRLVVSEKGKSGDISDNVGVYHQVTWSGMLEWVREVYENTRGIELPGAVNPVLLSELFWEQSSRWKDIAECHLEKVQDEIESFTTSVLRHVASDDDTFASIMEDAQSAMDQNKACATTELENLWQDERAHPITYNHYFTDDVQNTRNGAFVEQLEASIDSVPKNHGGGKWTPTQVVEPADVIDKVKEMVNRDMAEQACEEALVSLDAYYKVAMKTWIDNICRQVIERHLLRNLPSVFGPERVAAYSDEDLQRIAGERPETTERRKELAQMVANFEAALRELRR